MAPQPQKQTEVKTEILAPKTEPKAAEPVSGELEQLRAENERLKKERREFEAAMRAAAEKAGQLPAAPGTLPEKYRGTKQYRVGAAGAYRQGRLYSEGEIITIVDEVPSRTWTPYEKPTSAVAPVEAQPVEPGRAADTAI